LQLHLVPAGRRLDFATAPGQYAYVYRRNQQEPEWLCVAHNACSPFFDRSLQPGEDTVEYCVDYRDADGAITARTHVVQAAPARLPARIGWLNLG
jgi:hypothetical protein